MNCFSYELLFEKSEEETCMIARPVCSQTDRSSNPERMSRDRSSRRLWVAENSKEIDEN